MRLIDADALQAEYKQYHDGKRLLLIDTAPTIESRRGRWIERNPQNSPDCRLIECSECGNAYIVGYNIDYDDWTDGRNFCVNCGADMRPREREEQDD